MRRAFTLVEVIVALTIAGIIALAARAAIVGGLDTQERLQLHTTRSEGEARFRAIALLALRHMTDAPAASTPAFVVRDTVTEAGQSHIVEFYSRGMSLPAGTGAASLVRIAPTDAGLTMSVYRADGSLVLHGDLENSSAIRARARTLVGEWIEAWPRSLQLPAAVIIEFVPRIALSRGASPVPLVVTTQFAETP